HVLFLARLAALRPAIGARPAGAGLTFLLRLVHGFAELHRSLRQGIGLGFDRRRVIALERFLQVGHRVLDRLALALADLGTMFGQGLLGGVQQRLGMVLRLDGGLALLVFLGV